MAQNSDDDVFERLKASTEPAAVTSREEAVKARITAQYERAQKFLGELIEDNSSLPVNLASIEVAGAKRTRASFLEKVIAPAFDPEKAGTYTLESALQEIQQTTDRLNRFGIFHPGTTVYLDRLPPDPASPDAPTGLAATINLRERGRLSLKTGTDIGSNDASGYTNLQLRNIFGGAESLTASASRGLRERSAYDLTLATPLFASPTTILSAGTFSAARNRWYAGHDELARGVHAGLRFVTPAGEHTLGFHGVLRSVAALTEEAPAALRAEAARGESAKSALVHTLVRERRDQPRLPRAGYMVRHTAELAGANGALGGDVSFAKSEAEAQAALSLPLGCALSVGVRGGVLAPLGDAPSRIADRFVLGGPTDVRGFREAGLGPARGLGGDVYAAFNAGVFAPLPRLGPATPLRLQAFVNGGRLVAAGAGGVRGALDELVHGGLPSTAVGFGVCYAHPLARFELNFCLPVVKREGEGARKGLQFGVGMEFL